MSQSCTVSSICLSFSSRVYNGRGLNTDTTLLSLYHVHHRGRRQSSSLVIVIVFCLAIAAIVDGLLALRPRLATSV